MKKIPSRLKSGRDFLFSFHHPKLVAHDMRDRGEGGEHDNSDYNRDEIAVNSGDDAAQGISDDRDADCPEESPGDVIKEESGVVHPADSGKDRRKSPDYRQESRQNQGLAAVEFKELSGACDIFSAENQGILALEDPRPDFAAESVAERVAQYRRRETEEYQGNDIAIPL